MALAGLFEMADREFEAIQREDDELRKAARVRVEQGHLETVEITADALKAYLDRRLGSDGRMTSFSYDWTARLLLRLGFSNFQEIEELTAGADDDKLSRVAWGSRMGQLTRFEALLLATLGERFIERHPWNDTAWFVDGARKRLEALRAAGLPPAAGTHSVPTT
jgi:putative GTP pyrophosphokinase